jgi:UDP-glucose:glycoprotein glucosyltransferase
VARFSNLPTNHILTIRMDVPEPWDVQQTRATQDTDNLRCDVSAGCSDLSYESEDHTPGTGTQLTSVEYGLSSLLVFGQCYETSGTPPNGLQLVLTRHSNQISPVDEAEIEMDGSTEFTKSAASDAASARYSDTLVMKTVGYWQLRANPGVWDVKIAEESKGASIFDFVDSTITSGRINVKKGTASLTRKIVLKDFVNRGETLIVQRRPGLEMESLFDEEPITTRTQSNETINVFSLATGHLYERFLKIMMLSVTKRTSSKVKFWLFENFLSPNFKATARAMADRIGCEVEFVTYKWPEWLRGQSEKQRIIWGKRQRYGTVTNAF